jgi:hypothetical protein
MFYSDPGKIKSLRVNKFVPVPHPDPDGKLASKDVDAILERVRDKNWTAQNASSKDSAVQSIKILAEGVGQAKRDKRSVNEAACFALVQFAAKQDFLKPEDFQAPAERKEVKDTKTVSSTGPELKASPEDKPVSSQARPTAKPETPSQPLSADEKANKGTEETISWKALLGEEPASTAAKPESEEMSQKDLPDTTNTMSWAELMGEEKSKKSLPKEGALPPLPQGGGFGVSSFGAGFGGIGSIGYPGMGGVKPGGMSPSGPATPQPAPQQAPVKDVDEALKEGETISWKDLL